MEKTELLREMIPPLLAWYEENRRELPWRVSPTPYHVWLSEVMLQQTRIEAVIPYYERFLRELPTVADLAACPDDMLMKLWEGLGYYSRARNLKKAAITIMETYGGELPRTAAALRGLSGIGDYTAGAIASIAFGEGEPAVDGNVLRVLMRLFGSRDDIMAASVKKNTAEALRAVYPTGEDAKNLTEALMELGEVVCIPNGEAKCEKCPLSHLCTAKREGIIDELPYKSPKKGRQKEEKTVFLLSSHGLFAVRKREAQGLLAGLWELPNEKGTMDEAAAASYLDALGLVPVSMRPMESAVHIFTHIEWHMTGYAVECATPAGDFVWKRPEEIRAHHAIPTAFRAFAKHME